MTPRTRRKLVQNLEGYASILPALIGIVFLFVGPMFYSLYLSFTKYDVLNPPVWKGFGNYVAMFTDDPLFFTALANTVYYAFGTFDP